MIVHTLNISTSYFVHIWYIFFLFLGFLNLDIFFYAQCWGGVWFVFSVTQALFIPLYLFVAVFLGCTSPGWVGLCFLWFFVQELSKAQPAVVLVLKRLRRRDNGLKSRSTDWEKPGIEPVMPGLQDMVCPFIFKLCIMIVHTLNMCTLYFVRIR